MQTEFDLVIYGATGFTGNLATRYIMRSGVCENVRVAIAGRNQEKLAALQNACDIKPAIIIADSSQPSTIDAMVQKTKVVLSFAGPFALYGEPVIAACAKYGKDYLDITGETPFIRDMIERYQQQAVSTGARLIPFSGFDSIPADLSVFLALQAAQDRGLKLDEMCLYYQMKGGFNGGTLASTLNIAEQARGKSYSLITDPSWPKANRSSMKPHYEPQLQRWSAPFFMDPINKAVINRSAWLRSRLGEATPAFQYQERVLMGKQKGLLKASMITAMLAGFGIATATSWGRNLLRRFGPKPGEGPSEQARREGYVKGQLICRSHGQCKLIVHMEAKGDPGNEITVALASAASCLTIKDEITPNLKGFLTPSVAFKDKLRTAIEKTGFKFRIEVM